MTEENHNNNLITAKKDKFDIQRHKQTGIKNY